MGPAPFGVLNYGSDYGVEFWRGEVAIPGFDRPFAVIVRAGRAGASSRQIAVMAAVLSEGDSIRRKATAPMAALHREYGLRFPGGGDDGIWSVLEPEEIEVSNETFYGDDRIAVTLIFGSTLEPSFAPAVLTVDGAFHEVLTGS